MLPIRSPGSLLPIVIVRLQQAQRTDGRLLHLRIFRVLGFLPHAPLGWRELHLTNQKLIFAAS